MQPALYLQGFRRIQGRQKFVKIRQAPLTNYGPIRAKKAESVKIP